MFLALCTCTTRAADWQPLPSLPEPNGGFVCGVAGGKIVVIGGTNWQGGKKNWLDKKHSFDPVKMQWSTDPELYPKVAYAVLFQEADDFSFLGGFDGSKTRLGAKGVLAAGGRLSVGEVIVGGTNDPANVAGLSRQTWKIGKGQQQLADYPGKPFAVAANAVVGDELFVFGGMNYDAAAAAPVNATESYAFSPAKNTWRKLRPLAVANRGLCAVALDDHHIYLAGGYTDDFTASAVIYDVKADSYAAAKPLPYAAMVSLVRLGGYVYCLGGEDKKQSRTDKCYRIPVEALLR